MQGIRSSKTKYLLAGLLFAAPLFFLLNLITAQAADEVRLTTGTTDEYKPAVSGNKVTWLRGLNYGDIQYYSDVMYYEIGGSASKISTARTGYSPAISQTDVVWEDKRNNNQAFNTDIFGYSLPGGPETAIETQTKNQLWPATDGGRTVWQDGRNGLWDIYMKDTNGVTYRITLDSDEQTEPRIDGDLIVYADNRHAGGWDEVYVYDLSVDSNGNGTPNYKEGVRPNPDPAETRITNHSAKQNGPDISGRKITWTDWRNSGRNIYYYDMDNPVANGTPVDANAAFQHSASISGDLVVWTDWRNTTYPNGTNQDIYGKNLVAGQAFPVTTNGASQLEPDVSDGRVVWADKRYSHWDIYTKLYSVVPPTGTIIVNGGDLFTGSTSVTLTLFATDPDSSVSQMRFSDDNSSWGDWQNYGTSAGYALPTGDGAKTVYAQYSDTEGNVSTGSIVDDIVLDQSVPVDPTISGSTPAPGGWTADNTIEVNWPAAGGPGGASDALSGLDGFSVSWSVNGTETPDTVKDIEKSAVSVTSSPLADGVWWFNLSSGDNAGNWTTTVHYGPFRIDAKAPVTSIDPVSPDGQNGWYKTDPLITLTPDESATTHYSWNGGGSSTYTAPFSAPGDGTQTLDYFSVDGAGSREATNTVVFNIDYTLPVDPSISGSTPAPDGWIADNTIEINWPVAGGPGGASGAISGLDGFSVSWSQNDTETPDTTKDLEESAVSVTSSPLADGVWWFNLSTGDNAGNWTTTVHYGPFNIDAKVPVTSVDPTSPNGENGWYKTDPLITLTPDESATTHYSWNGGGSTTYTAPFNAPGEGAQALDYFSVDDAGSREATKTAIFKIDYTLPVDPTAVNELGGALHNTWQKTVSDPNFAWSGASDSGSGAQGYFVYWGTDPSGSPTAWTTSTDYNPGAVSSPAIYYLRVKTKDSAGNQSAPATLFAFKYDTAVPSGSIKINNGAAYTRSRAVTLNLGASDGNSGPDMMQFKNSGGGWTSWESIKSSKSWTLPSGDGTKRVYYRIRDKAGNAIYYSDTIVLDTVRPSLVKLTTPFVSTRISKTTTFKITWSGSDALSGMGTYLIRYRPANSSTWKTWKTSSKSSYAYFKGTAGRTYYFRAKGTDKAGNERWSKIYKTIMPYNEGASISKRVGFNGYQKKGKSQNYLTSVRYSYGRGQYIKYKVHGNSVGLVTTKYKNRGRAKIYIDGKYVKTVDAKSSKMRPRQLIFYKSWKTKRTHYIKIVNMAPPGRARFDIDGLVVGR